jgi:hypothetical protein
MCSETGALENGHFMVILILYGNVVKPGRTAVVNFNGFSSKRIVYVNRLYEIDGSIERNRQNISVVAGKSKGAVGQRESDASVNNAEPIDHLRSNGHHYTTVTFPDFEHFNTQPLAEKVIGHHVVYHFLGLKI